MDKDKDTPGDAASTPAIVSISKRPREDMDPDSPVTAGTMRAIFCEFLDPVKAELGSIRVFMTNTTAKLEAITELQNTIESMSIDSQYMAGKVRHLESVSSEMQESVSQMKAELEQQKQENRQLKDQLLSAECQSRRDNLKFYGIPENRGENCELIITQICKDSGLDINTWSIVRSHRLGPYDRNRIRPIIVKFNHFKERELVWMSRHMIRSEQAVSIGEDFPVEIDQRRKALYPILQAALNFRDPENADFRYRAKIVKDKLIINGSAYTVDTLDRLPEKLRPEVVSTPSKGDCVAFFTKASPLSNHHRCNFEVAGETFTSMEQYLMASKALHFKDTDIKAKVMQTHDPVAQKHLGKQVAGFDRNEWEEAASEILLRGLRAKFSQVEHCKDFLLATGKKTIGEANPSDKFFGIGMGLKDRDVWDRSKWANNLLGKSLMEVRNDL